jgi:hypothetical protein
VILVDTSVWIDHLRSGDAALARLLNVGQVLVHPFIVGELALGNLAQRSAILSSLQDLPATRIATDAEVLGFIERHKLFGLGIGYVDAHLMAAVKLTPGTALWTRDKRLLAAAAKLKLAASNMH